MNDVPSFSISSHLEPFLDNRFDHSGNADIENPKINRDERNCPYDNQRIVGQFFTIGPANLLEFSPAFREKGKQRLETAFHADYTSKNYLVSR